MLLTFIMVPLVFQTASGIATCKSKLSPDLSGKLLRGPPLWTVTAAHDSLKCATFCIADKECVLFRFNNLMKLCFGYERDMNLENSSKHPAKKLKLDIGSLVYKTCRVEVPHGGKCTNRRMCGFGGSVCYHNTCLCRLGFYFSPNQSECLKKCKDFGDSMALYEGASIVGYNQKTFWGLSRDECLRKCILEVEFTCKEVEIGVNGKCNLSRVGFLEVPKRKRERGTKEWEMGHRNCK